MWMWFIADCRLFMKSGSCFGLLYMCIIVWAALFFCVFVCICVIIDATFGMLRSSIDMCMLFFTYTVMSRLWYDV